MSSQQILVFRAWVQHYCICLNAGCKFAPFCLLLIPFLIIVACLGYRSEAKEWRTPTLFSCRFWRLAAPRTAVWATHRFAGRACLLLFSLGSGVARCGSRWAVRTAFCSLRRRGSGDWCFLGEDWRSCRSFRGSCAVGLGSYFVCSALTAFEISMSSVLLPLILETSFVLGCESYSFWMKMTSLSLVQFCCRSECLRSMFVLFAC